MRVKYILTLIAYALSGIVHFAAAQIPGWSWARGSQSPAGVSHALSTGITTDRFGNEYVTGYFESAAITFGDDTIPKANGGFSDLFLVKFDAAGNLIWTTSPGGTHYMSAGNSVITDKWGNVYLTGYFGNSGIIFGTDTLVNDSAGTDVFLAKYDSAGHVIWARSARGSIGGIGHSVAVDTFGNVYIAGAFYSATISFGSHTLLNDSISGYTTLFVVKYDSAGNVVWAQSPRGITTGFYCLATDDSANVYVAGSFWSNKIKFGAYTLYNDSVGGHTGEFFIAKYDSSGAVLWAKSAAGKNNEYVRSLAVGMHDGVYVAGRFTSDSVTFDGTTLVDSVPGSSNGSMYLVKYGSSGNVLWVRSAALAASGGLSVAIDTSGNPYLLGITDGGPMIAFGTDTLTGNNTFVVKYNAGGSVLWVRGCGSDLRPSALAMDVPGGIYIAGWYRDTVTIGSDTLCGTPGGAQDVCVAKLSLPVVPGSASMLINHTGVSIYPVPNEGEMSITLDGSGYSAVNIYDVQGRKIYTQHIDPSLNNAMIKVKMEQAAQGMYILQAVNFSGNISRKIVVLQRH